MENFILDQIIPGLKHVPKDIIKSYFTPLSNEATKKFREKTGFMKGICHPSENFEQVKNANIEWSRLDVPYPFDENGEQTEEYKAFLTKLQPIAKDVMQRAQSWLARSKQRNVKVRSYTAPTGFQPNGHMVNAKF